MHTLDRAKKAAAAVNSKYVEETVAISELEMISELGLLPEAVRQVGDLKESICKKEKYKFWKKYVIALQAALHRRSGDIAGATLAVEEGRSLPNANVHTRLVIEHLALLSKSSPDKVLSFVWSVWRSVPFTAQDRTLALFFLARSCYKMEDYKRATWWAQMALRRSSERGAIQMVAAELDVDHEFLNFLSDHIINSRELRAVELRIREMHASAIRHYRLTSERVSTKAGVKIVALGLPQVIVENSHVTSLAPLEIRLLVYLAENQRVRGEVLGELFWRGVAPEKQTSSLHTAIYHLRQSIGRDSIGFSSGQYYLESSVVQNYDVSHFSRGIGQSAELDPSKLPWSHVARETLDLYTGPFMDGDDDQWILERRAMLEGLYVDLAVKLALGSRRRDDAEASLSYLRIALKIDPYREDLNLAYMELLSRLGRRVSQIQHERRYRRLLEQDLGIKFRG